MSEEDLILIDGCKTTPGCNQEKNRYQGKRVQSLKSDFCFHLCFKALFPVYWLVLSNGDSSETRPAEGALSLK